MQARFSAKFRTDPVEAALVGLAYAVLMWLALATASWSNGVAAIWPCNAVLVAYLLKRPQRAWPLPCAVVFLVCMGTSMAMGRPTPQSPFFAAANIAESAALAWLVRRRCSQRVNLEAVDDLLAFLGAAVSAVTLSATIAALALAATGQAFGPSWLSWFAPDLLGLVIGVPLLLIGLDALRSGVRSGRRRAIEGTASLMLVALVSAIVFLQFSRPLLFLIAPAILFATVRMRGLGAILATLIVVAIGGLGLAWNTGPMAMMHGSASAKVTLLQIFFAVTFLTSLPMAAMLAERDRFSRRLAERERQFRTVVDAVSDVIFQCDAEGRWTYLNPAWETLTGYPVAEELGTSFLTRMVDEDRGPFLERLRGLNDGLFVTMRHQFRFMHASGDHRWGEVQVSRLNDRNGEITGSAGIIVDISDRLALAALAEDGRRRAEQEAQAALLLAATDELTGVASRRAFLAMLDQSLARGEPLAIALFDVDHFKRVNDRHGHAAGDDVLRRIATIAEGCVRDGDMVGRLGGEEFAVLMPGSSLAQAAAVGERLRKACAEALHPPGLTVTVSVGVTAAGPASTSATLLRDADAALYRAKFEGRNCLRMAA